MFIAYEMTSLLIDLFFRSQTKQMMNFKVPFEKECQIECLAQNVQGGTITRAVSITPYGLIPVCTIGGKLISIITPISR